MKVKNEPAFPVKGHFHGEKLGGQLHHGMTLRDYFAAQAMAFGPQNFEEIAGIAHKAVDDHREGFYVAAKFAYQIADAMLKARDE